ncbi:pre-rRNA-processing protein esf1 [Rutidosis leptorrhynchoides]|uniref:pre-rRNA-processing protein esf1 n=1 Tax=Rutidosis leptorrhynchoides TaxID=125765 RepID=UPI003A995160
MGSKSKKPNKKSPNKPPDAKTPTEVAGNRVFGAGNKVISDERFASSQKDPRFQDVPKHKNKVVIDSRFNSIFTDKNFSSLSARVDKRGKTKHDADSTQIALKQYYRLDDSETKPNEHREESNSSDSDDEERDQKLKNVTQLSESESGSESESDPEEEEVVKDDWTSTDTDEDEGGYIEEEETGALQMVENVPEIDKETNRLAVVNLDWNQVQAVDLFVVLSSFLPKSGQILSVSVYPSEFGLKRMEEEAVRGPVGLFDDEDGKNTKDDDSDSDNEIDNEKLRAYELSRLRYYFAVVVCDSIATADYLYKSCDGIEFERSSNKLDLRFIPDSMEFKHPARDVATEAPPNYEGIDFETRALQQSKISLTWDEVEPQRVKKFKRKINVDKESEYVKDEQEFKDLIASSDSESDEEENDGDIGNKPGKRQKTDAYRALLQSGDGSDEDEDEEDNGMDMEVTFNTGLEDLSKKIMEKKDKESETVWGAYLRKRAEKKKARKNRSKYSSDDESGGSDDEPVEEPGDFFAGDLTKKKKVSRDKNGKKRETDEEGGASRAELELLLAEDDNGDANVKGYNLKRMKSKGKKGKRNEIDEEKIPTVDLDDPRFSSLFNKPEFALDPTDPHFKRSATYIRQVAHKLSKGDVDEKGVQHYDPPQEQASEQSKSDSRKDKHEISMLVKSIKMKSKQLSLPSDGKKSKRKEK